MKKTAAEVAQELIFYDADPTPGQKKLLEAIEKLVTDRVIARLPAMVGGNPLSEVPEELEFIVTELIVRRFNRVGSEGMSGESVEGHSANYLQSDLREFEPAIDDWIDAQEEVSRKVVRFL